MPAGLDGRTVVVTGAASGIGRACAELAGREGARVILADLDLAGAESVARAMEGDAAALLVDVADPVSVDALVEASGEVDVLVHCAAVGPNGPVLELSNEDWRRVLAVNLDGTFLVSGGFARGMSARGSGTIILLASDRGRIGMRSGAAYAASKGGVIAFMKSLAIELGPSGVTVNAVNPGTTDTPLARTGTSDEQWAERERRDPLGRLSRPEEIAQIVLFLASPERRFMTGQVVTTRMRET